MSTLKLIIDRWMLRSWFLHVPIKLPQGTNKDNTGSGAQVTGREGQGHCKVFIGAKFIIDNVGVKQIVEFYYGSNNFATHSNEVFLMYSRKFNILALS